jgi:hypothetical protein
MHKKAVIFIFFLVTAFYVPITLANEANGVQFTVTDYTKFNVVSCDGPDGVFNFSAGGGNSSFCFIDGTPFLSNSAVIDYFRNNYCQGDVVCNSVSAVTIQLIRDDHNTPPTYFSDSHCGEGCAAVDISGHLMDTSNLISNTNSILTDLVLLAFSVLPALMIFFAVLVSFPMILRLIKSFFIK